MVGIGLWNQYWLELILISAGLALATTLVYKYMTNQAVMRELKKELKACQDQMKEHKSEPDKLMDLQKRSMKANAAYMKHSMKPMLITTVPFLLVFGWLKSLYGTTVIIPVPFWAGHLQWLGVYIIFSMIFTSLFRKWMNVV